MLKRKSKNTEDKLIKELTVAQVIKAWKSLSDKPVSYAKQLK